MNGITIDQLAKMCKKQQALGNGKKMILISSDDECNEYHQAWEGLEDGAILGDYIDESQLAGCLSDNIGDYVILT
jgi:hypothetical protein